MNMIHKSLTAMAALLIGASAFAGSVDPDKARKRLRVNSRCSFPDILSNIT